MMVFGCMVLMILEDKRLDVEGTVRVLNVVPGLPWVLLLMMMVVPLPVPAGLVVVMVEDDPFMDTVVPELMRIPREDGNHNYKNKCFFIFFS